MTITGKGLKISEKKSYIDQCLPKSQRYNLLRSRDTESKYRVMPNAGCEGSGGQAVEKEKASGHKSNNFRLLSRANARSGCEQHSTGSKKESESRGNEVEDGAGCHVRYNFAEPRGIFHCRGIGSVLS